jgi:hypothetical protein
MSECIFSLGSVIAESHLKSKNMATTPMDISSIFQPEFI